MKKILTILSILSILILPLAAGCGSNDNAVNKSNPLDSTSVVNNNQTTLTSNNNITFGSKLTIGAFYYPWYTKKAHWKDGYLRSQLEPAQLPFLNQYDCSDPDVAEQQIKWAKDYGVDYFLMSWWGADTRDNNNLLNGFLKAKNIDDIKFGILYETTGRIGNVVNDQIQITSESEAILKGDLEYLAETYFSHPSYLKYQEKPVIYIYLTRCFIGDYETVFKNATDYIKQKFGIELFIIGDEIYWDWPVPDAKKFSIMEATSIYNPHHPKIAGRYPSTFSFINDIEALYKSGLDNAMANKKHFIPDVLPGFNDMGVRPEVNHAPIPREMKKGDEGKETVFSELLESAFKYIDPELNTILVTSWNEWHEDTQIEPTIAEGILTSQPENLAKGFTYAPYGFKDLEIIKAFKEKYAK